MKDQGQEITNAYWVLPGKLLAGGYPGDTFEASTLRKLHQLRNLGIDSFIDLTEAGEPGLKPYAHLLSKKLSKTGGDIVYERFPVPDMDIPSKKEMIDILKRLDRELAAGRTVYLHCYGGKGRTGTVVGCFLVRHGMEGERALETIAQLRVNMPDGGLRSPETQAQLDMVCNWSEGQ